MAAFHSNIGFLNFTSIRRTEYGLRPYPATGHTQNVSNNFNATPQVHKPNATNRIFRFVVWRQKITKD